MYLIIPNVAVSCIVRLLCRMQKETGRGVEKGTHGTVSASIRHATAAPIDWKHLTAKRNGCQLIESMTWTRETYRTL